MKFGDVLPHVVKYLVDTERMERPERFISVADGARARTEVMQSLTAD